VLACPPGGGEKKEEGKAIYGHGLGQVRVGGGRLRAYLS